MVNTTNQMRIGFAFKVPKIPMVVHHVPHHIMVIEPTSPKCKPPSGISLRRALWNYHPIYNHL